MLRNKLFIILISFIIAYLFLFLILINDNNDSYNLPALGDQNKEVFAKYNNHSIHCQDLTNVDKCLVSLNKFDLNNILWLGNSQLHAINQKMLNDRNASERLFKKTIEHDFFLLTLSQPNSNLQEHYLLYEYILNFTKVDILILPVVFDDLRETNIRNDLRGILEIDEVVEKIQKTSIGKKIIKKNNDSENIKKNTKEVSNIYLQDLSEKYLNNNLAKISSVWEQRDKLRSRIFQLLIKTRNYVFRITPQSERKIIPQRYEDNIFALNEIIKSTKANKTKVVLYIPPLRNDVKIPYNLNDYIKFKSLLFELSQNESIVFLNFEGIVPKQFWGFKNLNNTNEIDFMHFKGEGHKILSDKLYQELIHNFIK